MANSIEEIKKSQRLYLFIFLVLFIFTIITVAVATVEWLDFGAHGFDSADAILGLAIASVKATLVMLIFMHLNHEKPLIYFFYGLGLVMAFFCMWLIGWTKADPPQYGSPQLNDGFYNPENPATESHH